MGVRKQPSAAPNAPPVWLQSDALKITRTTVPPGISELASLTCQEELGGVVDNLVNAIVPHPLMTQQIIDVLLLFLSHF